ncbi:MAG: hypothetical protein ACI9O4_002483 [Chitinophagales bacterium]
MPMYFDLSQYFALKALLKKTKQRLIIIFS